MHMAVTSVRPCSIIVSVLETGREAQDEIIVALTKQGRFSDGR
jgi:hypothetical protein